VPASWDETRVLNGVPLSFLGSGAYGAGIHSDGPKVATQPKDSIVTKQRVDAKTVLKLKLAPAAAPYGSNRLADRPAHRPSDYFPATLGESTLCVT
jgi:hypothetical protein